MIGDLLQNRIDLSLLVITKGLSKKVADEGDEAGANTYKSANLPQVALAEKMRKRDPASAPCIGDRVAYVIIQGTKGSKTYEKSEDPIYALKHNIPIDFTYYIENQIKLPLIRIFEPIFGDAKNTELKLFSGEHTRTKYQPKIQTKGMGMLGSFIKVKEACMACKNPLPPKCDDVICAKCQP